VQILIPDALLWLKRALEFTSLSLRRSVDNPAEELSVSFGTAYKTTLSLHHNFMIRPMFSVLNSDSDGNVGLSDSKVVLREAV
jgi:Glycolipid transfer protein (GLTP)